MSETNLLLTYSLWWLMLAVSCKTGIRVERPLDAQMRRDSIGHPLSRLFGQHADEND